MVHRPMTRRDTRKLQIAAHLIGEHVQIKCERGAAIGRVEPWGTFVVYSNRARKARYINLVSHEGRSGLTHQDRRDIVSMLRDYNHDMRRKP